MADEQTRHEPTRQEVRQYRPRRPQSLDRLPHDPTPREIRAKCEEIQQRWSPREREHRLGRRVGEERPVWTPPEIGSSDLARKD